MNLSSIYAALREQPLNSPRALAIAQSLVTELRIEIDIPRAETLRLKPNEQVVERGIFFWNETKVHSIGPHLIAVRLDENNRLTVSLYELTFDGGDRDTCPAKTDLKGPYVHVSIGLAKLLTLMVRQPDSRVLCLQ